MKIKHVVILLIPITLFGLWNSSRLYTAYSESREIINDELHALSQLPKPSRSTRAIHSNPIAATLKPIPPTTAPSPQPKRIVTDPPKQEIIPTSTSRPPKGKKFDISQYPQESFSACLKWMDDYRQLGEWLAYHYHVLPLRYLVFFRDPKSTMDPQPIFDKWSDRIQFEYWTNNSDFMTTDQQKTIDHMTIETKKHRRAQRYFYYSCIQHLYEKNRTWAIMIDTDEYLILDSANIANVPDRLLKPGAALEVIKKAQAKDPSIIRKQTPSKWWENCTVMARKEYPAFESPKQLVFRQVPPGIDAYRFVTLRFRHRGQKLIGKSMVDISTLDMPKIGWKHVYSHNLFDSCSKGNNKHDLMYVGHFLGSMEAYQRPADRRNDWMNRTKKFLKLNAKSENSLEKGIGDVEVRPWIQGFANDVGLEVMQYLLEDVGFPFNAETALQEFE